MRGHWLQPRRYKPCHLCGATRTSATFGKVGRTQRPLCQRHKDRPKHKGGTAATTMLRRIQNLREAHP